MEKEHLDIPVRIDDNVQLNLKLYGTNNKAKLFVEEDAVAHGEAMYQLVEGCEYEYEIISNSDVYQLIGADDVIRPSKRQRNAGIIRSGVYVGTMSFSVKNLINNRIYTNVLEIEIQSVKADYRTDYQNMLHDITVYYTELLMIQGAPVKQYFEVDFCRSAETLYQRFAFIKSIVESEEFCNAVHKILSNPEKKWQSAEICRHISNAKKLTKSAVRQFVTATDRIRISSNQQIRMGLPDSMHSIPRQISVNYKEETEDIQENQFVKYVLVTFYAFCNRIKDHAKASQRLKEESEATAIKLQQILENRFFIQISRPSHLNLNSPILQRKDGYRQVLQAWLMFDLASKLSWKGGDNVYQAGKRNVAALYEYWIFFKLLEIVSETFGISPCAKSGLIKLGEDQIDLDLRQGRTTALRGNCLVGNRRLNVCLYYNRTFSHVENIHSSGSWTTTMRPDYTLSIWLGNDDSELGEHDAEKDDNIVHIHFDAKYRVANIPLAENLSDNELNEQKDENVMHIYKRGDLLKMHAYKDAIRRTSGAYILYPGDAKEKKIRGFHEIIPGLGAFCLSPANTNFDIQIIKEFLIEIRNHFINRASQRERIAYFTHDTYNEMSDSFGKEVRCDLPEQIDGKKLLPNDTYVLLAYYKNKKHLDWILKSGLYNFRAGLSNGTLNLKAASASYLFLHHGSDKPILMRIKVTGPIVITRRDLLKKGYPSESPSIEKEKADNIYLLFSIEDADPEFSNYRWTASAVVQKGHQSAHPDWLSLTDLMLLHN